MLPRGHDTYSSASCQQQSSPRRGQDVCLLGAQAAGMVHAGAGGREAGADSNSAAPAVCSPAQGPWEPMTCQVALWAPRGKQHFHLSASTYSFIYFCPRQQGKELGATTPSSLGHCPRAPCWESEESGGARVTCSPFPSLSPQGSRAPDMAEQVLYGVCTHPAIPSSI